ncbi:hypothetical protein IHE45_19G140200 [Dioscorea alata]|uniref:Uncharacterized protein n=1 Tax=Dioscorea alata TaxID=55571 RepID=A0ACB7U244_DIOAL|nr:hypothetical protein IHE45_19G140200 [Dioscorea alata]
MVIKPLLFAYKSSTITSTLLAPHLPLTLSFSQLLLPPPPLLLPSSFFLSVFLSAFLFIYLSMYLSSYYRRRTLFLLFSNGGDGERQMFLKHIKT